MLDMEDTYYFIADLQWNIYLGTRVFFAENIERDLRDIWCVVCLAGGKGMRAYPRALTKFERCALQTKFAFPACGNHELVAFILFQQYRKACVAKGACYVADDLIEKCFKVKRRADLLRHPLKQKQLLNSQDVI